VKISLRMLREREKERGRERERERKREGEREREREGENWYLGKRREYWDRTRLYLPPNY
jgi:hypothetical protein